MLKPEKTLHKLLGMMLFRMPTTNGDGRHALHNTAPSWKTRSSITMQPGCW